MVNPDLGQAEGITLKGSCETQYEYIPQNQVKEKERTAQDLMVSP